LRAEELSPETPALITFTSGSTGEPKAAVRTHGLLVAQYHALRANLGLAPGQVDLATLPIFALASLAAGNTVVLADADLRIPGAIDPGPVLRQISGHGVTRCTAAPAFLERLLDADEARGRTRDRLTHVCTGGGPVFPRLLARLERWAPHARVSGVYGSTEAEPIAQLAAGDLGDDDRRQMRRGRGVPAGRPVTQTSLEIVTTRPDTRLADLTAAEFATLKAPAGEAGEIVVAGAHVLPVYLDGVGDAEARFTVAGRPWHRTGDAGRRDESGRLWLLGRCRARVRDQRGELYPLAVEGAASEMPGVRRTALASLEGQRVLVVELAAGADRGCLARLRTSLAWAQLDEIRAVTELPMDRRHNSKVDYPRLARILRSAGASPVRPGSPRTPTPASAAPRSAGLPRARPG
jgi:acyl-CoA synthetase (AMP-forming)/AMP-acid ligase II